jgi:hypothetical protein
MPKLRCKAIAKAFTWHLPQMATSWFELAIIGDAWSSLSRFVAQGMRVDYQRITGGTHTEKTVWAPHCALPFPAA